ncbi:peptidylprolyl isomerase [Pararhizobium haloflavum]|uniref:peptidylprolyl isomerase n=1 Tax=Pararhizobium haloflavum TaxID=2037914 RepID=UPI00130004A0|nr:peptidylprolyl isomerase [Pararhizobium haloflavum]
MRSKRVIPGLAVLAIAAVLGLPVPVASAQNEGVVARVGDTEITESDLAIAETMFASQTADMSPEARRSLLVDNLIDLELIVQAASAEGLRDDTAYRQRVEFLADQTLRSMYLERRLADAVSDDAVQREYDRFVSQMPALEEIRPRHILLADRPGAQEVIARLDAGEAFEDVAAELSLDEATKENGGDLGFVDPETILKEISEAAASLDEGEYLAEPVESAFGFHVVLLEEKRQRPAPDLQSVAPQIRQGLQAAAMQRIGLDLRQGVGVEKLVPDVEDEVGEDGHQH